MPTHDATTTASLARLACLRDYETCARQRLPADVWAYLHGGSADGVTQAWNEQAFQRLALLPQVLGQVAGGHTALELFGFRYEHPVFIAPTAYHALAHPDGEYATALASRAAQRRAAAWLSIARAHSPGESVALRPGRWASQPVRG
ncbi:FMN-dependent dehydrogenase [Lampropedia hyalina DSM 16112]|jgi:4-hydroxymandelate oxidase|uniref:FMN-dependent dehydrogenase n=1 Tax=Lampropedia hyalina DSM 16112 TaxID=1122156 RepID=A0A1M5C0Z5_9BURK|nr:alpha-hydroxy-acid oxidizing protein [Lampropedia hyalina]SHF48409.1 FMN-dependent dehydrogenase [Lampropedia hyalina DSM 16112]